jgi:hypothetical protein
MSIRTTTEEWHKIAKKIEDNLYPTEDIFIPTEIKKTLKDKLIEELSPKEEEK